MTEIVRVYEYLADDDDRSLFGGYDRLCENLFTDNGKRQRCSIKDRQDLRGIGQGKISERLNKRNELH